MPTVAKFEIAVASIQDPVKDRNKGSCLIIYGQQIVGVFHALARACATQGDAVNQSAAHRHMDSRRYPFAGDIGDHHTNALVID